MTLQESLIKFAENLDTDRVSKPVMTYVSRQVKPALIRNTLSGTYLGHPLHPLLTDIPIGTWLGAAVLDLVGGAGSEHASDVLIGTGLAAAVPTMLSGLNDWSDTYGPETRIGFAHAIGVAAGSAIYAASLAARVSGRRGLGRALGFAGLATVTASAYLGGHLSFARGMNVNHTAFESRPGDWTDVAAEADVPDGVSVKVDAAGASVLLRRDGGRLRALDSTCSHLGGPLDEGAVADGCVTCPWHGSVFRMDDGSVVRGPATQPQPTYDTRVVEGRIQVRANA